MKRRIETLKKLTDKGVVMMCAAAVAVILAVVYCSFTGKIDVPAPYAVLAGIAAILLLMTVGAASMLKKALELTIYAYKNIALIGIMIFTFFFSVEMFGRLFMHPGGKGLDYEGIYDALISFPKHFSLLSALIILIICILVGVSNIELMRREGAKLHNALGFVLALLYVGGTVAVMLAPKLIEAGVIEPLGVRSGVGYIALTVVIPLFFTLVICYLQSVFIGTIIMGWVAARHVPSYDKDYIIILGCSISKKGGLLPLLKGRVNRAVRFAWEQEIATGKSLKYVPSGGQGADEIMSEGSAMELYLLTRGAEDYEVFPEKKSTNTLENMSFSKKVIDELNPDAKIAFATTNYHILRSGMLARRAGFDAEGIAGDTKWYFWPNGFLREFVGILSLHRKAHIIILVTTALLCIAAGALRAFCFA